MLTVYTDAKVILEDKIIDGYVAVKNGKIAGVGEGAPDYEEAKLVSLGGKYLAPGFVEMHTHGAGGCDFMDGTLEAVRTAAMTHLDHGVTTLYPTTLAATREEILRSIDALREAQKAIEGGPHMPGLHMEGPYLNIKQKGAIDPNYIRNPDPAEYEEFLAYGKGAISRWTVAPELPGALEFARRLREEGILPSMGHTDAEYKEILAGYEAGFTHVTHLYSAMSSMVRRGGFRYPGLIESAFCIEGLTVEIIADGCHLPPEILSMVYRTMGVDRVALTCDSMRCAAQDVTESILGSLENGQRVIIEDEVAKMPDRTAFAGSIATDDRLVRVMRDKASVPLCDCVRMMTLTPARIMGIDGHTGSIAAGKDADLVCFDEGVNILGTMVGGHARGVLA